MSRDISWISEIYNNTNEAYIMWAWDTDNEGDIRDFRTGRRIGLNDGGKRVIIPPHAHLAATGCGVPDGGDKDGRPKCRVICKKSSAMDQNENHDPGRGLRLNRVMGPEETDKLIYRNHGTGREIAAITFPRGMEQNLILRIENDGIYLDVKEAKESTEWKVYKFGVALGDGLAQALKQIAQIALQAAADALMAV